MDRHEIIGTHASKGYSYGELFILEQVIKQISKDKIKGDKLDRELIKLERAIDRALIELLDLKNDMVNKLNESESQIFDAHQAILEDRYFINEIRDIIINQKVRAEYAVEICFDNYSKIIKESDNEYAKQRVHDLNDIKIRLIINIESNRKKVPTKAIEGHIIVVDELTPSIASMLCQKEVLGVVAQKGAGYLSHSAIILRGIGIPTINDVDFEALKKFNKSFAIIDGDEGLLLINPTSDEIVKYLDKLIEEAEKQKEISDKRESVTKTKDGHQIGLHANISNIYEYSLVVKMGIGGIGLVRTEMLFFNSKRAPSEKEQVYIYSRIAKRMKSKPVIIRTLDIGDDKFPVSVSDRDKDAYENLRGIARSLAQKEQLKLQIRSIIQAANFGNVSISIPMVNNVKEILEVRKLIKSVSKELRLEGIKINKQIRMGVIIETRTAVENIRKIISKADFISIGTNDLFGQVMDVDRKSVAGRKCEYCEPKFLGIIKRCINEALRQKKQVSVCGEMAADPMSAILLIGMGVNDLSISPSKFINIHRVIGKLVLKEATDLSQKALECKTADDVRDILSKCDI